MSERDTLRASVFDAFVELGILDENRAISDLLFEDSGAQADIEDIGDDADVRTLNGDRGGGNRISFPSTPTSSVQSTPKKPRTSKLSQIKSRFSPRKTSRKFSQETDEGYVSTSSVKRPRKPSRLRKQSTRKVTDPDAASTVSKGGSFFHRKRKTTLAPSDSVALSDSEWDWEEVTRPSLDADPGPSWHQPAVPPSSHDSAPSLRRPKSLRNLPKISTSRRSNSVTSLPSSPFLFVVPQFQTIHLSPDDCPTPDALLHQYASGRQMYPVSKSKARKSSNLIDNDDAIALPRPMSFDGSSSSSRSPVEMAPLPKRTASLSRSQSQRQIPFPTKPLSRTSMSIRRVPSHEVAESVLRDR
ncbi:hypothetical protein CPB85DRAFT_1025223 [Mucidula mucida]|nr:hypothetical protein CPB85DRAFT_225407 [Mucidula mucida]KAF8903411.1 hypothetical protein CPB85DRAFT_1025223 [Mucidula mucida]